MTTYTEEGSLEGTSIFLSSKEKHYLGKIIDHMDYIAENNFPKDHMVSGHEYFETITLLTIIINRMGETKPDLGSLN